MRTYGTLVAILASSSVAAAQPGGSDLPIEPMPDAMPAAVNEQPAPEEMAPPYEPEPEPQGPMLPDPDSAPTRATFVSTSEQPWDVFVDRQPVCATPCTLGLSGVNFVALKTQENQPIRLDVGYLPQGELLVSGTPLRGGMYAGGIVMTSFAGMALVTGITLTAVGFGTDRSGMQTAGLITGVAGAVGLYGGIYLMRKALPTFSIGPVRAYAGASGVAGTF